MVQIQDVTPADDDAASSGERLRLAGNAAYASGDFEAAARSYRESLEAAPPPSPSAPYALGNRAKALLRLGRAREALADAEACVRACPSGSPYAAKARFRKGEALEATGALDRARGAFRDAVGEAPGDRDALEALRRISEAIERRREDGEDAKKTISAMAPRQPPMSAPSSQKSRPKENAASPAPAAGDAVERKLRRSSSDETSAERRFRRAKRALREERYEEALRAFEAYTPPPARPDRAVSLLVNRARALTELGRHEEALRDARAATRADAASPRARYRLGVAALAAARARAAEATRLFTKRFSESTSLEARDVIRETADRRARALALAAEARDEGFGRGARLDGTAEDDAAAFAEGRRECERFLESFATADWEMVEVVPPEEDKNNGVFVHEAREEAEEPEEPAVRSSKKKPVAATVPVAALFRHAARETARREAEGSDETFFSARRENVADETSTFVSSVHSTSSATRETHEDDDLLVARFRESIRHFGCAIVRLPASLVEAPAEEEARAPRDVFAGACAAAGAFFRMRPNGKTRSLPNTRAAPHGYLRPLEETRVDSTLGSGAGVRASARRDETCLERFSACALFDASYVWPSARFKARLDDARGVLEATAKHAGDAFLIERFEQIEGEANREALEAYEATLASIVLSPESQRMTLAWHPDPGSPARGERGGSGGGEEEEEDEDAPPLAALRAALEPIARVSEAEPERTFLSFFPRVCDGKDEGKTRTPSVRVRRGDAETFFSAARGAGDASERDVLVVAGERFRDIMGESWTAPDVSFERDEREGPCVRLVYRV